MNLRLIDVIGGMERKFLYDESCDSYCIIDFVDRKVIHTN